MNGLVQVQMAYNDMKVDVDAGGEGKARTMGQLYSHPTMLYQTCGRPLQKQDDDPSLYPEPKIRAWYQGSIKVPQSSARSACSPQSTPHSGAHLLALGDGFSRQ